MNNDFNTKDAIISDQILDIWQNIVDTASEILSLPVVMINRLNPPELEVFRSNINPDNPFPSGTKMPMEGVYCEGAAKRRKMVQVENALKDPQWADSLTAKAGIISYLGFPLFWPDQSVFGTICVVDTKENHWGNKYEKLLFSFKTSIETHLSLVEAYDQISLRKLELEKYLKEIKILKGILPMCSHCKKIRNENGDWQNVDDYIEEHSEADFSHGICPECKKILYSDLDD